MAVFGNPKVHLPEPLLRIELENTACWSFDWGNSEIIAIGCTNGICFWTSVTTTSTNPEFKGYIAVYDIADALSSGQNGLTGSQLHILPPWTWFWSSIEGVFPTHYVPVHQSAIRAISWIRVPTMSGTGKQTADNPTVVASGGYDGMECVTDLREGVGNVLNRTRGMNLFSSCIRRCWLMSLF